MKITVFQMLLDARSARSRIPQDRYDIDGFYHPDPDRLGSIQQTYVFVLRFIGTQLIVVPAMHTS